mmetsp:Transcript_23729/g.55317  ORF Transcript_23729/g.55317 Transcript_23729/m.55317 type:complete len:96 (-) Transcript_23729:1715-2002(-)
MPSLGNPFVKGDLYVIFRVAFPKDGDLGEDAIAALQTALPGPSTSVAAEYDEETAEVCHLEHANVRNFGKGGVQSSDSVYDEDEDEPETEQCAPS